MDAALEGSGSGVAIIGAGLGGLSASIYLRLEGYRVTVFEKNDTVGGRANVIEAQGFRFDTGPSLLNYPWVFRELFAAAGRRFEDYVDLLPVEPSVLFQWEDGSTFQLSSNLAKLGEECNRLEAGSRPALLGYLRDAGRKYDIAFQKLVNRNADSAFRWLAALRPQEITKLAVWRTLDGELRRFFKNRYIREAFGSYGMYLGGSPFKLPGLFSILAYGELAYGLWLPRRGIYGLVEGIVRLAKELGVEFRLSSAVTEIVVREDRVEGIKLGDGSNFASRIVVSNVDVPTTNSTLLQNSSPFGYRSLRKRRMTPGVVTFYWGVRGRVSGLGHHTIFLPDRYREAFEDLFERNRIPEHLPFYVSVPSETDTSLAPIGDTAMFVLVPTPVLSQMPGIEWPVVVNDIRQRILERLKSHGVDLGRDRIVFEEFLTPADWKDRFGLYDGSAFGIAHGLFQVGPFRPRNYSATVHGLFYTGASTTPGTGMPMVTLSGRLTAERVVQRMGKPELE